MIQTRLKLTGGLADTYTFYNRMKSDGSSYIDTGFSPTNTSGFKVTIQQQSVITDDHVFGSRFSGRWTVIRTDTWAYLGFNNNVPYASRPHTNKGYYNSIVTYENNYLNDRHYRITGDLDKQVDVAFIDTLPSGFGNAYIYGYNNNGTAKLYSYYTEGEVIFTDDDEVVKRFIPAKRNSDNVIGMYELEEGTFYTNAGSGSFTVEDELFEYGYLNSSDLYDVAYTHTVNNGSQLTVGTVASAELTFKSETQLSMGDEFTYYCAQTQDGTESETFTKIGIFIVKEITKDRNLYSYTCYDYISKFDVVVDDWYNALTYPINIAYNSTTTILGSLCTYLGLSSYECQPKCNGSWNIASKMFDANFLTGRYILGLCAQIAGGYACADADGKIWLRTFGKDNYSYTSSTTVFTAPTTILDTTNYTSLQISDFDCPRINQLNIQYNYNGDVYEIEWSTQPESGRDASILDLKSNQWTYGHTLAQIRDIYWDCWDGSFWRFQDYRPCTVKLLKDYGLNAGDYFYIKDYDGNSHLSLVMSKKITANGVELQCDGSKIRDEVAAQTEQQIDLTPYLKTANFTPTLDQNLGTYGISTGATTSSTNKGLTITEGSWIAKLIPGQLQLDGANSTEATLNPSSLYIKGSSSLSPLLQIQSTTTTSPQIILKDSSGSSVLNRSKIDSIGVHKSYYIHTVHIKHNTYAKRYVFSFVSDESSNVSLSTWLSNHGHVSAATCYPCNGPIVTYGDNVYPIIGICYTSAKIYAVRFDDVLVDLSSGYTITQSVAGVNV